MIPEIAAAQQMMDGANQWAEPLREELALLDRKRSQLVGRIGAIMAPANAAMAEARALEDRTLGPWKCGEGSRETWGRHFVSGCKDAPTWVRMMFHNDREWIWTLDIRPSAVGPFRQIVLMGDTTEERLAHADAELLASGFRLMTEDGSVADGASVNQGDSR